MKIGIDISPLQTNHRMRGIGAVTFNLINNLPQQSKDEHEFVFYADPGKKSLDLALRMLNLDDLNYEVRYKPVVKAIQKYRLPGKLKIISKLIKKLLSAIRFKVGQSGYDYSELDVFLLIDPTLTMPRMPGVEKFMIAYDLIPYIIEWDYLHSYKTVRDKGLGRKAALAAQLQRNVYISKVRSNVKKSVQVIAISEQTKADFVKYAHAPVKKIKTIPLGVNAPLSEALEKEPNKHYVETSWGYVTRKIKFGNPTPYILFLGGTDARRKINDLVTAFNHLRAEGHKLNLVLSGDILEGAQCLPVKDTREALSLSSYKDDIIYLGFTDEPTKAWLYRHALAFVYPSRYEGFGLPVLEAMSYSTPVIAYENGALQEITDKSVVFAKDALGIKDAILEIIEHPDIAQKRSTAGIKTTEKYTWQKTADQIIKVLTD